MSHPIHECHMLVLITDNIGHDSQGPKIYMQKWVKLYFSCRAQPQYLEYVPEFNPSMLLPAVLVAN